MEDPKRCPKCGHKAVRVRYVNPKGREITSWPIWLFFGVSVLILIGLILRIVWHSGNHLIMLFLAIVLATRSSLLSLSFLQDAKKIQVR